MVEVEVAVSREVGVEREDGVGRPGVLEPRALLVPPPHTSNPALPEEEGEGVDEGDTRRGVGVAPPKKEGVPPPPIPGLAVPASIVPLTVAEGESEGMAPLGVDVGELDPAPPPPTIFPKASK